MFFRNRWKRCYVCYFLGFTIIFLLYWMKCRRFSKRCRLYAFSMNDTCVWCACEVWQSYLCKIIWIAWKFFRRINILCFIDCYFLYYKHFTTMSSSCISQSVQPQCLDRKYREKIWWICVELVNYMLHICSPNSFKMVIHKASFVGNPYWLKRAKHGLGLNCSNGVFTWL